MPWFAAAVPIAMMAVSAVGQQQAGQAAEQAAEYNAAVERQRGQIAMNEAGAQADQIQRGTTRKLGDAHAAYGASGVTMDGSPLDVMADLATEGELTKQMALYRGKTGQLSALQQAQLDLDAGQAAAQKGNIGAGSTILTGASKFMTTSYSGAT